MTIEETTQLTRPDSDRHHVQGAPQTPVTLVENDDYQCPYCGQAYPILKEVQRHFDDRLRCVFRIFPLTELHEHAAEAAAAHGTFWVMHDMLFEHQQALCVEAELLRELEQLGLGTGHFTGDMAAHRYTPRVREDFPSGVRSGVNGTPTFFINGMRFDDAWDVETLSAALEAAVPTAEE